MGKEIKGIIVPMVTPFLDNGDLDKDGVSVLVEHLIGGGVHGIFILGTTGEAQSMSMEQRKELVRLAGSKINGRVAFLVGVSDTSMEDALSLTSVARDAGADGVVMAPPYYYQPSQTDLVEWFTYFADNSPLPVYLYNMPSNVKVMISPETVARLAVHGNIKGLKDSSHNMTYFQSLTYLVKNIEDFVLFVGPEEQTAQAVLLGAAGGVNGGANMFPQLYVKLYEAAAGRNLDEVKRLQETVLHISTAVYGLGSGPSSYLQGLKGALEILGICNRRLALPYTAFDEEKFTALKKVLSEISVE